ncbi:uncharacterized protein LOC110835670 isoform X2 [Zootermopsis nevadensis]|uniref:uncharacterized protein LOC110835670 isoform X2 n=1 Tax=Zootermopsis nevadensis TaxID=136037 RepID=UPI000B8EB2F5|nr:uncharacterized protein LOC110835670 isoform X2 [Zootermopsis nevadensis]
MRMTCSCDAYTRREVLQLAGKRTSSNAQCRWLICQASRGMVSKMSSRAMILWTIVMVMAFSCRAEAAPEAFIAPADFRELQQIALAENGLQDAKKREEIATLFQLLEQYHNEWQQQQKPTDEETETQDIGAPQVPEDYSNLPNRMPVETKFFRSQDGVVKDETKRGNYPPPLCYFKICNMGRKRNPH